jgi:hypothetical protein
MTASRKPPAGPPPSAGVLAKYVRSYAQKIGVSEGRVRAWISYMILAGLLERWAEQAGSHRFTIKGGVALELRLLQQHDRSRATKDIDLILHDLDVDLVRAVEHALATGQHEGFVFRRKGEPIHLDNGTASMELAVTYQGGVWTSIAVDVARAEPGEADVELIPAIALREAFGVTGPTDLPCLPLRLHIAQKLHGMTLPARPGKQNERFRDLVDLVLLEPLVRDYAGLREACEQVFRDRGTHDWPPRLEVPPHWSEPFTRLARDLELPVADAQEAMIRVGAFVDHIRAT